MVSGGTPETGFSTGAHFTMARRGLVDLEDFRIIWTAGPIPNSPVVVAEGEVGRDDDRCEARAAPAPSRLRSLDRSSA
ncbi:hypothetical protein [uncultured Brevundimonas sp.]|uniref:hypothetical protein n=1 Tax=uncultured Brevundimonas sp. TaxID=213418 RepID=UPI00262B7B95|nr:hypothetical protein [uncultured Brevundimonas sp.]